MLREFRDTGIMYAHINSAYSTLDYVNVDWRADDSATITVMIDSFEDITI